MATLTPTADTGVARRPSAQRSEALHNLALAARSRRGRIGLVILVLIVAFAMFGPFFAPHSPTESLTEPLLKPKSGYPLGTDFLGRDVLSRVMAGGRVLLVMALCATAGGVTVGAILGVTAAYVRGATDGLIMRTVDIILAFPQLVFALLLVSVVGPKTWLIVIAVGFTHAPPVARVLRSSALDVTERDFVKSIELEGVAGHRIMRNEILPNLVSPLMVEIGLRLTYSIGIIAGLGFLGFGQPPPAANWGLMISENLVGIQSNPWAVIAPAAAIALLTIGTNTFTDAFSRVAIGADRPLEIAALAESLGGDAR
jgi:peptide/nickel transport system permease protein